MDLGLRGKIAMVGGASKGLGFAVARALAGEGAQLSIAARDATAIYLTTRVVQRRPLARCSVDYSRATIIES